jgi:hypothetical protein
MEQGTAQPNYITPGGRGATITTAYVERQVKAYAVFETEVEALSSLNAQTTVFFSIAWSLLSFAVGIWTTAIFTDNLSPKALVASQMGAPLLVVLACVFFWLARSSGAKRLATIASIKQQSTSETRAV